MKAETNAGYFTGFFAATFKYLQATGLPLNEVLLLEEMKGIYSETFALAIAHAHERALAIQKGMNVLAEGLNNGAFQLHADDIRFWFIPQAQEKGHDSAYSTYGETPQEAKMAYVLTHTSLPIPMDAWLCEYC